MRTVLQAIVCAWSIAFACAQTQPGDSFVLQGGTVHTISGPVIENGSVLVRDGKIVAVGKGISAPEGYRTIDVTGQHVYPGMIDSASMIGMNREAPQRESVNPQFLGAAAVNPSSTAITAARLNGVTSAIAMPEGELLPGQMSLVHLDGGNATTVVPSAAIHLRFPAITLRPVRPHEPDDDDENPTAGRDIEPIPYDQAKQARDEKLQALRSFFEAARRYREAKLANAAEFRIDTRYEAMLPVLDGSTPMFVTAVREAEIRDAIEFADHEHIRIILADAYESYKVLPLIQAHKIAVVLGPPHSLPLNPDDPYDLPFTLPKKLREGGVKFSIGTFSWTRSRNLPYQAATAVAFGLPQEEAYRAVSLSAAEILGVAHRLGSIDEGKIADLIVADGDPLKVTTKVNLVFINGKPASVRIPGQAVTSRN